jgi:hypothetical protein
MAFNPYQFPMTPVGPQSPASAAQDNAPTQYKGNPGGANNMPSQRPQFHPSGFPVNPSQPSVMPVQGQNGQRQPSMQAYDWTGANSGSQAPRQPSMPSWTDWTGSDNSGSQAPRPPTLFDMQRDYRNPQGQKPSPYNQQQNPIKPGMPVGGQGGGSYQDLIRRMMDRFQGGSGGGGSRGGGDPYEDFMRQRQAVGDNRPMSREEWGNSAASRDPNSYEDMMRTRQENGFTQPYSREQWEQDRTPQDFLMGEGPGGFLNRDYGGDRGQGRGGNRGYGGGYQGGNANFFGGQAQNVGRYRPPTMDASGNWADTQPYNYNLPNAHGSYSGYGQGNPNSPNFGFGYGGIYDPYAPRPPIPGGG